MVNSREHPHELNLRGDFNIATADASRVCRELGLVVAGLTVVNTAILGALIRATAIVDMTNIEKVVREKFSNRALEINLAAIKKTYEITEAGKRQDGDQGLQAHLR